MKLKVGIFTTNSVDKIHPRIEMQLRILNDEGYDVELIRSQKNKEGFLFELLNLISLKYFKKRSIANFKKRIIEFDIVHVYDLQLLPLVKFAKGLNKKVIYETLDDNVHLHFYALSKKIPGLKTFEKSIIKHFSNFEKKYASKYCDSVIVNSPNLLVNFEKANLIYYSSNLEGIKTEDYSSSKETRFIYIGKLSEGKGAREYKRLIDDFSVPMIFIGNTSDNVAEELSNDINVDYRGSFDSIGLKQELNSLIKKYNLIGLSIIIPENKSYALQEANKDIDYLCVQIPFIGNTRKPTYEKIKEGVGVLFSDEKGVNKLIYNKEYSYDKCRSEAKELYRPYSSHNFKSIYLKLVKSLY